MYTRQQIIDLETDISFVLQRALDRRQMPLQRAQKLAAASLEILDEEMTQPEYEKAKERLMDFDPFFIRVIQINDKRYAL